MDKEIQEMFRQKNKEIIKNNLKLDIERNINSLNETIVNIFNNNFDIAIKNINLIFEDSYFNESNLVVTKNMNKLKMQSFDLLISKIDDKKNKLIEKIDNIDFNFNEMEEYYGVVFSTTVELVDIFTGDQLYEYKKNMIKEFNKYIEKVLNNNAIDITKSRINDYITYRLFGKIQERSKSEFMLRDNSLANKGRESYNKYQEICEKTANV